MATNSTNTGMTGGNMYQPTPKPPVTQAPPPNPYAQANLVAPVQNQTGGYLMPDRPDVPLAPDPYDVAQQQIGIGEQVQGVNAVDQSGVFGQTQYQRDPTTGGITGVNTGLNAPYSGVQNTLLSGLGSQPGDVSNAVYGQYQSRLDPQWQTSSTQLRNQLINQGIPQGSDAWNTAMQEFERNKSAAYLQANQAATQAGGQEQSRLLGGLLSLGQSATSGYQTTPAVATPSTGAFQYANFQNAGDVYNQQLASYNNAMQGLFGMGGSVLDQLL